MEATQSPNLTLFDGLKNILRISTFHFALFLWFWKSPSIFSPPIQIIISILLCYIHQKEVSEWIHEASHYNFFPGRFWNDFLTNTLVSVFSGFSIADYRNNHFRHHQLKDYFREDDPDTANYIIKDRKSLLKNLIADLTGFNSLRLYFNLILKPRKNSKTNTSIAAIIPNLYIVSFWGTLSLFLFVANRFEIIIIYGITYLSIYSIFLSRFRVYGQHVEIENGLGKLKNSATSRTIDAGILDRIFFTSRVMMYHYEHHNDPNLPYRRLMQICVPSTDVNRFCGSRWAPIIALYKGLN